MDAAYTQRRTAKYRGPSTSDDYNRRLEENYKDLVVLFNRARLSEVELAEFFRRIAKDQLALSTAIAAIEGRIETLEGGNNRITFYSHNQIDNARFDSSPFAISSTDQLTSHPNYGILTLPKIDSGSLSKVLFTDTESNEVIPPSLETRVVGTTGTADSPPAFIDSSAPEYAFYTKSGLIWERNVVVDSANGNGSEVTLYIKLPSDLFTTEKSNGILLQPFPNYGITIREIAYTLDADPVLRDSDGYIQFNTDENYVGEEAAKGWVVPGGWTGASAGDDALVKTGLRAFYFEPKAITALRIKLFQDEYYQESGKYIYTYGLTNLDIRYDKFAAEGRAMIRMDAPSGNTITTVSDVQPQIWNVSPSILDEVFDYRVIWETAPDSGTYTETPVPNSNRVWIEVTLKDTEGWTPALSGLTVTYS